MTIVNTAWVGTCWCDEHNQMFTAELSRLALPLAYVCIRLLTLQELKIQSPSHISFETKVHLCNAILFACMTFFLLPGTECMCQ